MIYSISNRSTRPMNEGREIIDEEIGVDLVNAYASQLDEECGKKIIIEADTALKTGVKIEFAENHDPTYITSYR